MERFTLALALGVLAGLLSCLRPSWRPTLAGAKTAWLIASVASIVAYWAMGVW